MTNTTHQFTVKNIKTFTGREGYGYSCNLYLNNKKVAELVDHADGGPLQSFWIGPKNFDVTIRSYDFETSQKYLTHKGTESESILEKMVMDLPMISLSESSKPFYANSDIFLDDLVNDTLLQQKISRLLKKEVLVLNNKKILSYKIKPTQDYTTIKNYISKNKPTEIIINEKPIEEIVKIFKEYS